jgi:hypothetical protein
MTIVLNRLTGLLVITMILGYFSVLASLAYFLHTRILYLNGILAEEVDNEVDEQKIKGVQQSLKNGIYFIGALAAFSVCILTFLRKRIVIAVKMIKVRANF